jgi:hypothetical protein
MMVDVDEFELAEVATVLMRAAKDGTEQRAAVVAWLRAARLQVCPDENPDETIVPDALIAALEALDRGATVPLLTSSPNPDRKKFEGEVTAAKGRAIAAIDFLHALGTPVPTAVDLVCERNGMAPGSLKGLRKSVRSKGLNPYIAVEADLQLGKWQALLDFGLDRRLVVEAIERDLKVDRAVLVK